MNLLNGLIVLFYFILILLKLNHKYTGFMIILLFQVLLIFQSLGNELNLLINDLVLNFSFYLVLISIILSFVSLFLSFLITVNFKILHFLKKAFFTHKLINIKKFFLIMFLVFLEEIYFRLFTLSFFVYFFNSDLSAIIITSIIFSFYHVDKVKYTNKVNYSIKIFDLFTFSIILSAVFILIKNFWVIIFIHFFRNIILTGISIKSSSDSK